jgi:hypothetical protein
MVTLRLKGTSDIAHGLLGNLQMPPSTFYGPIRADSGFEPTAGMDVQALIDEKVCGQGSTLSYGDQVVYVVSVNAAGPGDAVGCGVPGAPVTFLVGGQLMATRGRWDNNRLQELPLAQKVQIYLPWVVNKP